MAIELNEKCRRVVSINGHEQRLHNVTSLDISGSWTRIHSDEGYVLINPDNVLMYIIDGKAVL